MPVELNTPFNANVEPIVDSADDAVICFLTTGLQALALGDWLLPMNSVPLSACERLIVAMSPRYHLIHTTSVGMRGDAERALVRSHDSDEAIQLSTSAHNMLLSADASESVGHLCAVLGLRHEQARDVLKEGRPCTLQKPIHRFVEAYAASPRPRGTDRAKYRYPVG